MSAQFLGRLLAFLFVLLALTVGASSFAPPQSDGEVENAYRELLAANHWRTRNAARDRLIELGESALDTVLIGTEDRNEDVRATCHEILRGSFPTNERAVAAFIRGLSDSNRGYVTYPSAFHLGEHKIEAGRDALRACLAATADEPRTHYAAAKSLGELGDKAVLVTLWNGLGSDDAYTRYLSNLGVKALAGRDLSEFDYEGAWEGAFVSGPALARTQGRPVQKAQKRADRWQAIVRFTQWLKAEKPELIAELSEKLW